jgi:hypothetical protein
MITLPAGSTIRDWADAADAAMNPSAMLHDALRQPVSVLCRIDILLMSLSMGFRTSVVQDTYRCEPFSTVVRVDSVGRHARIAVGGSLVHVAECA